MMFLAARSRVLSLTWLLVPTLLWSLFLRIPVLCIDPFVLLVIERHIPPKLVVFCRLIWVVIFAMTLLMCWNIFPYAYLFYLHEALPFTPRFVLGGLCVATVLLLWFSLLSNVLQRMGAWYKWVISFGVIAFLMKISAAMGIVYAPSIRQYIKSPTLASAHLLISSLGTNGNTLDITKTPENTFYSFIKRQTTLPTRIVVMVVESWGEKGDTLAAMAGDVQNNGFQVKKYGFTSYINSTLSGEFRELCSKYVQPSDDMMDEMGNLSCAPQYLYDKGYQVTGVHGYQPAFYARSTFWTRFGIKNQLFGDKFKGDPQCPGPFPAICDENLIRRSIDILDNAAKPALVYILTISSHEPLDPAALDHHGNYFSEIKVDHPTQVVTRRAISALMQSLKAGGTSGCTLAYIAGDHQPPSASAQGGIFEVGKVPYLAFTRNCPAS
jgi:hypothetical protein